MGWECIVPEKAIEDVKKDKRCAKRVEQYLISDNALYFEGKYLPIISLNPSAFMTVHTTRTAVAEEEYRLRN